MEQSLANSYSLYQKNIIEILKESGINIDGDDVDARQFFLTCVALEYEAVADRFNCGVRLNPTRLEDAQERWIQDIGNQRIDGEGVPDQFKHAGLLGYWLRRCQVVDFTNTKSSPDTAFAKNHQQRFLDAPNEILAFLLGFNLAAFYTFKVYKRDDYTLSMFMRDSRPTDKYIYDVSHYLKEKHVSPHSVYLIYRAFFETTLTFRSGYLTYT